MQIGTGTISNGYLFKRIGHHDRGLGHELENSQSQYRALNMFVKVVAKISEEARMIKESISLSQSCDLSASLLQRVHDLRGTLADIEKSLQEKHLKCCLFPELGNVDEIAPAIVQLSARRIGALIAIERSMSLEDFITSGTLLNAELSNSLLLSLFFPGSSMHDGAVIIRNRKIAAAGCILPLSADHNTFKVMGVGTRHRAGVGLSQVSDAAVFIVSEQTGRVTLAVGGQMFHEPLLKHTSVLPKLAHANFYQ